MKKSYFFLTLLLTPSLVAAGAEKYRPPAVAKQVAAVLSTHELTGHIRFLASDLLEGRGPGSRGDRLTQEYIAAQFETLGLKPLKQGTANSSYLQPFTLVGVNTRLPQFLQFLHGGRTLSLKQGSEFMATSGQQQAVVQFADAEVVFVGYGIQAPEYDWDDYKGVDLKGKVLLMMNNDPASDPNLFAGSTRLYYGRWTYKYEMAAKLGAAGALIIHTRESAGYPWQVVQTSWSGEQFSLPYEGGPTLALQGWLTEEAARRLVAVSGWDLDQLRALAEKREFKPVPLKSALSVRLQNTLRRVETANVLGILPGSHPERGREVVIYTAHHDHLGVKENAKKGEDAIYNGALDNASGIAGLLTLARAFASLPQPPARSVLFAAVAAEEQGLLGSKYLATHPVVHPGLMAANINMDGLNIWGPTSDITMVGKGKSTLDAIIESVAAMQGRAVKPDQFPDRGFFYRSDQFNFAKIGVPAAYFDAGTEVIGKPPGWGKEQIEKWESEHYHQVSDELRADWNLEGAVRDLELNFYLGYEVAQRRELPAWNRGDEFEAARMRARADLTR